MSALAYPIEACPPTLAGQERPRYGGVLFFHQETGLAGCQRCGWSGAPTIVPVRPQRTAMHTRPTPGASVAGYASTRCPSCEREPDTPPLKVPRNAPCPCGSGLKAKRCDCAMVTV